MTGALRPDAVVVSDVDFGADDPAMIVESNVGFLNDLFAEHLKIEEVSADALRSYYVDYYLAEVNNGGFSQFVYNSRWDPGVVRQVREGLQAMGAVRHLDVFEEGARLVEGFGPSRLEDYFESDYFDENPDRDELNAINDRFEQASEHEDLLALNASWLRGLPNLVVLTVEEMRVEVRRRAEALPDRDARIAEARANAPRFEKLIRALCEHAGLELDRITAGDPTRMHEGERTLAWHFLTDQGHHHMVESGGKAILFRGHSTTDRVCEIEAPED
jgi:hypothetical protein